MSVVDSVRSELAEARDRVLDATDPALTSLMVGLALFAFFAFGGSGDMVLETAAVTGGGAYLLIRKGLEDAHRDPVLEVERVESHVAGEVVDVARPERLGEVMVGEDLERRARRRDEALVLVETVAPENRVLRWLSRRWLVAVPIRVVEWLTGDRVTVRETETVLVDAADAPEVGVEVALAARDATAEVPVEAVEPIPEDVHPSERSFPNGYEAAVEERGRA